MSRRPRPRLRLWLELASYLVLAGVSRWLPRRALAALGRVLGTAAHRTLGRRQRTAMRNVVRAFPDMAPRDARKLVRRCWQHFGQISLESLALPRIRPGRHGWVRVEGLDHVRRAYASGKGVLLFTGHFGHWELCAVIQGHAGLPLSVVARPLDNPLLEKDLSRLRECSGNRVIYKRNATREILKSLKAGSGVALLIDQDARDQGIFVPFFGHPASTTDALARLALRTGAAVVPARCVAEPKGRYRITYGPPLEPRRSGDREADARDLTARCTGILESWIRECPEQWLWMHRRWKTRPRRGESLPAAC